MSGSRRTDKPRKRATYNLDAEVLYRAKVQAAKDQVSISEFVEQALIQKLSTRDIKGGNETNE